MRGRTEDVRGWNQNNFGSLTRNAARATDMDMCVMTPEGNKKATRHANETLSRCATLAWPLSAFDKSGVVARLRSHR